MEDPGHRHRRRLVPPDLPLRPRTDHLGRPAAERRDEEGPAHHRPARRSHRSRRGRRSCPSTATCWSASAGSRTPASWPTRSPPSRSPSRSLRWRRTSTASAAPAERPSGAHGAPDHHGRTGRRRLDRHGAVRSRASSSPSPASSCWPAAGFDDLPSGCRIGAATTPTVRHRRRTTTSAGTPTSATRTPSSHRRHRVQPRDVRRAVLVDHALGRAGTWPSGRTPTCPAHAEVDPEPGDGGDRAARRRRPPSGWSTTAVRCSPTSACSRATEAGRIADTVKASGVADIVAVAVGAM